MNILFLGPACPRIETRLHELGHVVTRREEPLDAAFLQAHSFDFGISYRYQHILTQAMLDRLHNCVINMHISLLPWNRGNDPNLWSFLEDTPKGVTIHKMDAGLDTGDILLQQEAVFDPAGETLRTTHAKLSTMLEDLFLANAEALLAETIPARKQPQGGSCHRYRDKTAFLDLLEEKWWDTPVQPLVGAALKQRGHLHERERGLTLRDVRPDDMAFVFNLANDPDVRRMSFHSEEISWETHQQWFARQLAERNPFCIACLKGTRCGYVRMQPHAAASARDCIVSFAVAREHQGQGVATWALRTACRQVLATTRFQRIYGMVKTVNQGSARVFAKAHFRDAGVCVIAENEARRFVYPGYAEDI